MKIGKVYNFSAGPAILPEEVLLDIKRSIINWNEKGISILEISHRSKIFNTIYNFVIESINSVIHIPKNYSILLLPGGATMQFTAIPMNLLGDRTKACYINSGVWSQKAINEAAKYCEVIISAKLNALTNSIPEQELWYVDDASAYFHYTSNETIDGVEFHNTPYIFNIPIVSDMSSNLFTKRIDITKFDLIYASTQKNLGIAGLTLVIVKNEIIKNYKGKIPNIFDYNIQIEKKSTYNTPSLLSWYTTGLMMKWIKKKGGLKKFEQINKNKARLLYDFIDSSKIYKNNIDNAWRSTINIIFFLPNNILTSKFMLEAEKEGIINICGHASKGGIRVSLYNAIPITAVKKLIGFMKYFEESNITEI